MATNNSPVTPDTSISVKISCHGQNRKFKLPLSDLTPQILPGKLRSFLGIAANQPVVFERYSDSAGAWLTLDPANVQVYKTLFRAAKAKLKLRLRATAALTGDSIIPVAAAAAAASTPSHASFASAFPDFATLNTSETTLNTHQTEHANHFRQPASELALRMKKPQPAGTCSWSVYCNACDLTMANEHYHCNICDDGDYDLCEHCVKSGVHCPGDNHWLIKRFVNNGQVITSTTEKLPPKDTPEVAREAQPEIPGAFTESLDEKKLNDDSEEEEYEPVRTCNSCVREFPENQFVTCLDCDDFDLCITCHEGNKHGHHPGHTFEAVAEDALSPLAEFLCAPGRNTKHAALCDGCDKSIFGVRYKCLNCPDWDYCSECVKNAKFIHPMHRFAPLYEPIAQPRENQARHVGIYCDGPLCSNKHDYIDGVRYKCAVCHDTDFCANCEAYPYHKHNRTHPLIKMQTSIRSVSVTTTGDNNGKALRVMGDHHARHMIAPSNTASPVQTIVDVKPAEASKPLKEKIHIKDLLSEPIHEKIKVEDLLSSPIEEPKAVSPIDFTKLEAQFMRETVPDSTVMQPDQRFVQVWTMRNPGPVAWPAGCSVRYVGGDNMLNVEKNAPSTTTELSEATETNVMGRPVEVGEEIAFRVTLRSPLTEGTKISYWRLKTANGHAFGHRLWCHIHVSNAAVVADSEPIPLPQVVSPEYAPATVATTERSEKVGRPSFQDNFLQTVLQQRIDRRRELEQRSNAEYAARQKQVSALESARFHEERAARAQMLHNLSSEIRAVEIQHKAKVAAAKAAVDAAKAAKQPEPLSELPAPVNHAGAERDFQLQLRLLEQQNARRLAMARELVEAPAAPVVVKKETKDMSNSEGSGMIFPRLDKESPASSTHALASPNVKAESVSAIESEEDFFEDAESVELVDDSTSEDGFLTDEEYDILDASDEESFA